MNKNKIKIGVVGLGTVGSGVINLLEKNKEEILKRSGISIDITCISAANKNKNPWVLDPVGAGATPFRDEVLSELLNLKPIAIRGNASEILALAKHNKTQTKGVDSTASSLDAIDAARFLNKQYNAVVIISGETDVIVSDELEVKLNNGNSLMTKITGMGCSASAILAAFLAVIPKSSEAAVAATALISIAGEISAKSCDGPGSLQVSILDKLHSITENEFLKHLKIEN